MKPETSWKRVELEVCRLLKSLKSDICDDYRASDEPDDNTPAMQITIGMSFDDSGLVKSWNYQTGDNSYSGGAYGHRFWGVDSLTRRCNSRETADRLVSQCVDQWHECPRMTPEKQERIRDTVYSDDSH